MSPSAETSSVTEHSLSSFSFSKPSSASLAMHNNPQRSVNHLQSRFATQTAQHKPQLVGSLPDTAKPTTAAHPGSNPQVSSSSAHSPMTDPSQRGSDNAQEKSADMSEMHNSTSRGSLNSLTGAQAASSSDRADSPSLRMPFGLSAAHRPQSMKHADQHNPHTNPSDSSPAAASPVHDMQGTVTALQRLSMKASSFKSLHGNAASSRPALHWEPARPSVDSPDKQELGRRKLFCL